MKTNPSAGTYTIQYPQPHVPSPNKIAPGSIKSFAGYYGTFTSGGTPPPGGAAQWSPFLKDGSQWTYEYQFSDDLDVTVETIDDVNHFSTIPFTGFFGGQAFNYFVRSHLTSKTAVP